MAYHGDLDNSEVQSYNLAKSLAQHADDTFEIADTILVGMVERIETDGTSPVALDRLNRLLAARVLEQPRLRDLFVYDENGRWLAHSIQQAQAPAGANNSDRAYFKHHKGSADRGPHLGPPIQSRSSGKWIVTVSRRLQHADGSFAGVALATIDVAYFSEFYRRFNVGDQGTIALIQAAGPTLARFPHSDELIGRDLSASPLLTELAAKPSGTRRYVSPIDGVERISGFQRGARFPVVLLVGVARQEAVADWRQEAALRLGAVAVLILLIAVTGLKLAQQVRTRQEAEGALARSEAAFRLLAENSSDMVSRIGSDGRRRYVSPASFGLLGYSPTELEGTSAMSSVHPDDLDEVQAALATLRAGHAQEVTTSFRTNHRSGAEIWLETSVRVAQDRGTGRADGVVAVSRDITARKQLETQLLAMARTDGLTGLANRRAFDDAFDAEMRRSSRHATALSLILIDVDRFKLYNDTLGHLAGDECLRAVAKALAGVVGRPGDMVARYGGEEFVLLLPSTDSASALIVAERARKAVEAIAIRHPANPPACVVTISAGLATASPNRESRAADPGWLIETADAALYQAKAAGRNRCRAAPSARAAA